MSTGPLCEASGADSTTRIFELEQLVRDKLKWLPAVYNYILYWDALVKLCEERRNMVVVAWHRIGGNAEIGEGDIKVAAEDEVE